MFGRFAALVALFLLGGATAPRQPPASVPETPQAIGHAAPPPGARSPRNASYAISARLDPASRDARRATSVSRGATRRVDPRHDASASTSITTPGETRPRRGCASGARPTSSVPPVERPNSDWGWIDVTSIASPLHQDVDARRPSAAAVRPEPQARFIAPDDGNADDRTVMEVPLDRAVAPGETIDVQIAWTSRVPRTFARTGAIGNFYFIAQWFPKIGVLEDTGWNCHQFHSATEFFADFGTYDVRLTVPKGWMVGRRPGDRTRTRRDEAGRHDDPSLLPGRRPRLRVDDEPRLRRAARQVRASDAAGGRRCACCCSRSMRARPTGTSRRPARR